MAKAKTATPDARPLKNAPLDIQALLAKESEGIASKIAAPSGDRIKLNKNGTITCPDGSEGTEIEVVILDFVTVNLFYDRPYDKDVVFPPACFAIGPEPTLLTPSKNCPSRIADTCSACPNNQFGSALNGKGKACKNSRLVAVSPADAKEGDCPIWIVSVPPTSIKPFDAYVSGLAIKNKTIPVGVVTSLTLDPNSEYASPRFSVVRPLSAEELPLFFETRKEATVRLLAEPDVSGYEPPKPAARGRGR